MARQQTGQLSIHCPIFSRGRRCVSSPKTTQPAVGLAQLISQWVLENFPEGGKATRAWCSSTNVKNEWSYTSIPPCALVTCTATTSNTLQTFDSLLLLVCRVTQLSFLGSVECLRYSDGVWWHILSITFPCCSLSYVEAICTKALLWNYGSDFAQFWCQHVAHSCYCNKT